MAPLKRDASATKKASSRSRVGFYQIVNDYLGFFRGSNSQKKTRNSQQIVNKKLLVNKLGILPSNNPSLF